jgi:hypothetical protein
MAIAGFRLASTWAEDCAVLVVVDLDAVASLDVNFFDKSPAGTPEVQHQ